MVKNKPEAEAGVGLKSAAASKLPICSCIPDPDDFRLAKKLLKQALELKVELSAKEEKLEEIKDQLAAICEGYSLGGFRYGLCGFAYRGYVSRDTLRKKLLISLGVTAEQIQAATVPGKEFLDIQLTIFDVE